VHERIRRAIGTGWTTEEWAHVAMGHPIARLLMQRKRSEADALLRQYTAVHEAGHGLMAKLIGVDVEQIVIGHLHEVQGATTLGFTEYRVDRRRPLDAAAWVLLDLAGIAGHETVWPHGWGLDQAAWTPPGETGALRGGHTGTPSHVDGDRTGRYSEPQDQSSQSGDHHEAQQRPT